MATARQELTTLESICADLACGRISADDGAKRIMKWFGEAVERAIADEEEAMKKRP